MAICKACGRDIAADMMFCPYCGTKRTLDETGKPVEEVPEQTIGVIPYVSGSKHLEGIWTLIITDKRFVFARALAHDRTVPSEPKEVGLGLLAIKGPESGCGLTYAQRYQEMTPDEALKESSGNFEIKIDDVVSCAMSQNEEDRYSLAMTLHEGDLLLSMPQQHDHRNFLRKVLGDRLTW
jgi:hypothetical protein